MKVPDIGDFDSVAVIEVLIKPGDTIKAEQSLITVESDKASMEIPSSHAGVVKEVKVKVGDKVSQGSVVAVVEGAGGAAKAAAPAAAPSAAAPPPSPQPSPAPAGEGARAMPAHEPKAPSGSLPHASPSVRRFARELGVPLDEVKGSGPKGRITQEDVQGFVKGVMSGDTRRRGRQRPRRRPAAGRGCRGCCRGRRSTSRSSGRSSGAISPASRRSRARTCIATG